VYPNKKLPGHYGVEKVSIQNLLVADIIGEKNLLLVRGAVPGFSDGMVVVKPAIKSALRAAHKAKK
jgi:large subunit ribosomal protein L3